jgi:cation:H+ antiporter
VHLADPVGLLAFHALPLAANVALFALGALVIWVAGTRLARYADAIAERTGTGRAFIGALLLGGITSLPEIATTITASAIGNAPLAVNNLFGGVAMQVAVLAAVDVIVRGRALTARVDGAVVLLQGALLVVILTLAAAAIAVGDVSLAGVGAWTTAILVASIGAFFLIHRHRSASLGGWRVTPTPADVDDQARARDHAHRAPAAGSTRALVAKIVAAGAAILVAGILVARTGDVLAEQSGLGASFMGVLLVAVATSLPEASTTIAAVRLGQYEMAFSNIFGANILDLAVLFLADAVFVGAPVLSEVGRFSLTAALLGILLTGIFLAGLIERRERVVLAAGVDSHVVLAVYLGGMVLLYTMR